LSLSPSRATAGQQDLEDAQQEVHGRGGAAAAAGLRASEPRHAGARLLSVLAALASLSSLSLSVALSLPSLARSLAGARAAAPRPGAAPVAPAPPQRRTATPLAGHAPRLGCRSERVCAADRGRSAAGRAGTWTMRTHAARRVARGPPRGLWLGWGLCRLGAVPTDGRLLYFAQGVRVDFPRLPLCLKVLAPGRRAGEHPRGRRRRE
jgi:hypothetical protein